MVLEQMKIGRSVDVGIPARHVDEGCPGQDAGQPTVSRDLAAQTATPGGRGGPGGRGCPARHRTAAGRPDPRRRARPRINRCIVSTRTSGWSPSSRRSASSRRLRLRRLQSRTDRVGDPRLGTGIDHRHEPRALRLEPVRRGHRRRRRPILARAPRPRSRPPPRRTRARGSAVPAARPPACPRRIGRPGPAASTTAPTLMIPRATTLTAMGTGR